MIGCRCGEGSYVERVMQEATAWRAPSARIRRQPPGPPGHELVPAILPRMAKRSRSGRVRDALIWGACLGAAAGAVLGAALDGVAPASARSTGAVV